MISYYILHFEVSAFKKAIIYTYLLFIVILSVSLYWSQHLEMLLGLTIGTSYILWYILFMIDFAEDEFSYFQEEKAKEKMDENTKT